MRFEKNTFLRFHIFSLFLKNNNYDYNIDTVGILHVFVK